jgi:catechol 2,3-dioxygenase-like lactoylglutathione lyase family enzyme
LGYDTVIYDETRIFDDLQAIGGGKNKHRRVLLRHSKPRQGAFSRMFGATEIELVQCIDAPTRKIFQDRYWGDCGYIHLCFDVANMPALRTYCAQKGFDFTVDSSLVHTTGFDMGEAAGNFSYIEDPDGTLIEFVETHKIPILKKIGWYLHLKNRNPTKPLPDFMLKAMALNRKKN